MKRFLTFVIVAALLPAAVFIVAARGSYIAEHGFQTSSMNLKRGRAIFSARCARCHNVGGTSVAVGPNLAQIGSHAAQRKPDISAADYLLESILRPAAFKAPGSSGEMPGNLMNSYDDEEVRGVVAYLCSLGGQPVDNELRSMVIDRPAIVEDDDVFVGQRIMRGESLYRDKAGCATCHPFYSGVGYELLAPSLFYRGFRDRTALLEAITKPHEKVPTKYQQTTVLLASGIPVTGRLISQSESEVVLLVRENRIVNCRTIPISELETDEDNKPIIQQSAVSDMPSNVDQLLTGDELEDLVQFLLSLN